MGYCIHRVLIINTLAEQCAVFQILVSYLFTTYGYGDNESGSRGARSYPTSYIPSGYYNWGAGRLYHQVVFDHYWSSSIASSANNYSLRIDSSHLLNAYTYTKSFGLTLRYMPKFAC